MSHRTLRIVTLCLGVWLGVGWPGIRRAHAETYRVHYVTYAAGFRVLDITGSIDLDAQGYGIDLTMHTLGLIGLLMDGDSHSVARGYWSGATVAPLSYDSRGHWDGQARQTVIDYKDGQPVIQALQPANEREREPVPPALQANTVDSLGAMAALVRAVASTGRCDGATRIFDGRRLSQIWVRTGGLQVLPPTARSSFRGQTLRCDFDGQLLAGFKYGDDRARAARAQHGVAWLAPLTPGGAYLPVRIQFATRFFGDATMYLAP